MLSNFQINSIANDLKMKLPLSNILMKNELKQPRVGNYVINLQSTFQGKGTHWTCLIIEKDDMFFFDSFGAPPYKNDGGGASPFLFFLNSFSRFQSSPTDSAEIFSRTAWIKNLLNISES